MLTMNDMEIRFELLSIILTNPANDISSINDENVIAKVDSLTKFIRDGVPQKA
jgi:hypothetical protein